MRFRQQELRPFLLRGLSPFLLHGLSPFHLWASLPCSNLVPGVHHVHHNPWCHPLHPTGFLRFNTRQSQACQLKFIYLLDRGPNSHPPGGFLNFLNSTQDPAQAVGNGSSSQPISIGDEINGNDCARTEKRLLWTKEEDLRLYVVLGLTIVLYVMFARLGFGLGPKIGDETERTAATAMDYTNAMPDAAGPDAWTNAAPSAAWDSSIWAFTEDDYRQWSVDSRNAYSRGIQIL
nr:unnamed protein product [Digitaria exilis]